MHIDFIRKIKEKVYTGESKKSENGTELICKTVGDDYLHSLFYGLSDKEEKQFIKTLDKLKKRGPHVSDLLLLLKECNGGILYAGSLNLFGFDDGKRLEDDKPSSIVNMNISDYVGKSLNQVIYFGNMPYIDGGNLNLYLNTNTGLVSGYYDQQIIVTWTGLSDFFEEVFARYDTLYGNDGKNVNYGLSDRGVYNNIQKFYLKERVL